MSLTMSQWNLSIGDGQSLFCMLGLNVLEDADLAMETARILQSVTAKYKLLFVFKASFDKANRSSMHSFRGPGLATGLKILSEVKSRLEIPIITDIHEVAQAEPVSEVADILQIPAFLCRQTDLIIAGAKAVKRHGGLLQIKKGQFLAPGDCRQIVSKVKEAAEDDITILCERGTSFGYNNLIVDMLSINEMKKLGVPVTIDATHAVQLPGADPNTNGMSTGGRRDGVEVIARSAIAAGADGIFVEFHPEPHKAKCDGPSCLPLSVADDLLRNLSELYAVTRRIPLCNFSQATCEISA